MADRIGPRPVLSGGLVAFALASAAFVLAGNPGAVGLTRFGQGAAALVRTMSALGIRGRAPVRDVWTHQDLGRLSTLHAELPIHGCLLAKVTPEGRPRYQAAFAAWGGGAGFDNTIPGFEAMGYARIVGENQSVTFVVTTPRNATCQLDVRYHADRAGRLTLGVEQADHTVIAAPRLITFRSTAGRWATLSSRIKLTAGENLITLMRTDGDTRSIALNYIEVG